jgi:alpha-tubulin suppressor-like RCC1 family protein
MRRERQDNRNGRMGWWAGVALLVAAFGLGGEAWARPPCDFYTWCTPSQPYNCYQEIPCGSPILCYEGSAPVCGVYVSEPTNSCYGRCGGTAPSGCSCSAECGPNVPCCSDFPAACGATGDASCAGRCGAGAGDVGGAPAGCSCAADCGYQGNCCSDVIGACASTSPFTFPDPLAPGAGSQFYVASPEVGVTVSTASDGPSGKGVVLWSTRPVAPVSRSIAGLTSIGLHRVNFSEERAACSVYQNAGMWEVQSWVNWSDDPADAWTHCAARAFSFPVNTSSPPSIRQTAHAQDVGNQSPQEVDMGPANVNSLAILTNVKFENVNSTSYAKCLIFPRNGDWKLRAEGNGPLSDMWCDAQVIQWPTTADLSATGTYAVTSDSLANNMHSEESYIGPAQGRLCFMTDVLYYGRDYAGHTSGDGGCQISERNDGFYLKTDSGPYMSVTCSAQCLQSGSAWPPAATLRGVVGPGETPAPGTDAGIDGSGARLNLYQSGAYDKPIVIVEGFDPIDRTGPGEFMRLLSPAFHSLLNRGADIWMLNVSGQGDIASLVSREVAKAIGNAYTYDPPGTPPPWNVANPGKKIPVAGFSQGGLDTRVALASWEDGRFGPSGSLPVPGLPNPTGPPPVSLFMSINGPQFGAEAPLSLQHTVNDLSNSLQAVGISLPPEVTNTLRSTPARQMLRHLGDVSASGVVTESCGWFGFGEKDTIRGPESASEPPFLLNVYGDSWPFTTGTHDGFQFDIDARGSIGNGFPQSVYSVGFSNGSFSPQGCANRDGHVACTGDPLVSAIGTNAGSIYSTVQFTDTGHSSPTGLICERNTKMLFNNTVYDEPGGDLSPGRLGALADLPNPFKELKLLKAVDTMPVLFTPTESALDCPGAALDPACTVLDANGRRDHAACDAVCRASNRDTFSPRFDNVFSNPANLNGSHYGLSGPEVLTALAYIYEYLLADGDGDFASTNPFLPGGQPPAGEHADCDDTDPSVNVVDATPLEAGYGHGLSVHADGTAWAWGWNQYGQLGDGTYVNRNTQVRAGSLTGVVAVGGGIFHSVALKCDGTVWAWGGNAGGQLGDGTTATRNVPGQVQGLAGVIAIAVGANHNLALKRDGTVWAWGDNTYGQIGDGTTIDRPVPVPVGGLSGVASLGAGYYHSGVVKSDGTVWTWGYNGVGELGDGTHTSRSTPGPVPGLTGVTRLSCGGYFNLALLASGGIKAWGHNFYGQLGDGTFVERAAPVSVAGIAGATGIAAGAGFSLAVRSDGTAWAWGQNVAGELGDGTTTNRATPGQVAGLANVVAVAGGEDHSLARLNDGRIFGWGSNAYGQVGAGPSPQLTPAQIP